MTANNMPPPTGHTMCVEASRADPFIISYYTADDMRTYAEQQMGMVKILLADVLANIEGLNLARFEELRPRIKDFLK